MGDSPCFDVRCRAVRAACARAAACAARPRRWGTRGGGGTRGGNVGLSRTRPIQRTTTAACVVCGVVRGRGCWVREREKRVRRVEQTVGRDTAGRVWVLPRDIGGHQIRGNRGRNPARTAPS